MVVVKRQTSSMTSSFEMEKLGRISVRLDTIASCHSPNDEGGLPLLRCDCGKTNHDGGSVMLRWWAEPHHEALFVDAACLAC